MDKYMQVKRSMALSALVQAQSLPRELVRSQAGVSVPSPFPVREESKSDEIELDARFDTNNYGYCECWPDLNVPLLQTGPVPALSSASLILRGVMSTDTPLSETLVGIAPTHTTVMRDFGGNIGQAIRFTSNLAAAGTLFSIVEVRLDLQPYEYPIDIIVETFDGAAWQPAATAASPFIHVEWFIAQVVNPPQYIRLRLIPPPVQFLERRKLAVNVLLTPFGGVAPVTAGFFTPGAVNWDVMRAEQWPYLTQLPDLDRVRNLGYEALCTYTGSRQLDGGKIAAALVPFDWSPTYSDPFQAVSSVRHNKYSSALRDGAHGTWRVGSHEELNPTSPQERSFPAFKLVFGYIRNSVENQSLRIRATGLFGVYSDSPILGLAPFVPALLPHDLDMLMQYFQTAPAVCENPLHQKLKSAAQFLGRAGLGVAKAGFRGAKAILGNADALEAAAMAVGQPEIAAGIASMAKLHKEAKPAIQVVRAVAHVPPKKKKKG